MVVFKPQRPKPLRDGLEPRRFWSAIEVLCDIRAVDNLRQETDGEFFNAILGDDRLKAAFAIVMPEFHTRNIEWDGPFALRYSEYLIRWDKEELGLRVYKLLDEPGTGYPINLHPLTRNPLHLLPPPCNICLA